MITEEQDVYVWPDEDDREELRIEIFERIHHFLKHDASPKLVQALVLDDASGEDWKTLSHEIYQLMLVAAHDRAKKTGEGG